jgi:hypothetical protein
VSIPTRLPCCTRWPRARSFAARRSGLLTPVLVSLLARDPNQRPTMHQAHEALVTLAASLAGRQPVLSAPAPPPSRYDRPVDPVPTAQQTLIQASPLEETITSVRSTGMDATAGPAPVQGQHHGWPAQRKLITGVMTIVLLAAGVLVAVLISHANVTGANVPTLGDPSQSRQTLPTSAGPSSTTPEAPTSTSSGPARSPQALPAPPGPSSTTPVTPTIAPAVPGSSQGTPEQLAGAITDYYVLVPGKPAGGLGPAHGQLPAKPRWRLHWISELLEHRGAGHGL